MNILITGASKGIGYELVKQFAKESNNYIIAIARSKIELQNLQEHCKKEYNNEIYIHTIDFLAASFEEDFRKTIENHPAHFDIIVNNAGYLVNLPFTETTQKENQETYQVNVFAPIFILQTLIPKLDNSKSCHIINIGSMGGVQGSVKFTGLSIYSSSKAALANLTECLAEEYKDRNIAINCLALGSVQTEMLNKAFPDYKAQVSPQQMAIFITDFALNKTNFFNGKIIPVSNSTP